MRRALIGIEAEALGLLERGQSVRDPAGREVIASERKTPLHAYIMSWS